MMNTIKHKNMTSEDLGAFMGKNRLPTPDRESQERENKINDEEKAKVFK